MVCRGVLPYEPRQAPKVNEGVSASGQVNSLLSWVLLASSSRRPTHLDQVHLCQAFPKVKHSTYVFLPCLPVEGVNVEHFRVLCEGNGDEEVAK